jgi:hypothetical protein
VAIQVTARQSRQLSLFKSRRQRGTVPPAPSEFASQAFLVDVIRRWIDPRWKFTHIPHGEAREHRIGRQGKRYSPAGQRLRRLGVVAGWPDLQFAGPGAQMAFLGLKRRGERLSKPQEAIRDHLVACGFDYLWTDDVDAAIAWLKARGILRGGFTVMIG